MDKKEWVLKRTEQIFMDENPMLRIKPYRCALPKQEKDYLVQRMKSMALKLAILNNIQFP